jgi:hypothetical protein
MTSAQLEEEEASVKGISKKPKKKGKDDFDLLNAALAAAPKSKAQKQADEKKRAEEERRKQEAENRERNEARRRAQEEERRAAAARGIVIDHGDELMSVSNTNRQDADVLDATGIEAGISVLTTGDELLPDSHPEKRQKALHNAYVEKMLPVMKKEYPGLKLSQYKERIFESWKTSPENPRYVAAMQAANTKAAVGSG